MVRPGWPGDGTPSIESLRELRLRALFNDLVKDMGPGKLAEQFGVDRKTLWRWQQAAELPPRLAEALERMLLERAMAAGPAGTAARGAAGVDPGPVAAVKGWSRWSLRFLVKKRQHFQRLGGESIANALGRAGYYFSLSGFFQRFPPQKPGGSRSWTRDWPHRIEPCSPNGCPRWIDRKD